MAFVKIPKIQKGNSILIFIVVVVIILVVLMIWKKPELWESIVKIFRP